MNEQTEIKTASAGPVQKRIAVVGGGLAGLVAANVAARAGAKVTLFEGAKSLGGRALTTEHEGFHINMGPHALYAAGAANKILKELGVEPKGAMPVLEGTTAIFGGEKYRLPVSIKSVLLSRFLGLKDKLEILGFYGKLPKLDAVDFQHVTQKEFVETICKRPRARHYVNAMCRLGSYCNAPELLSAEIAISQLKLGLSGVLYIDKGWATLVDALAEKARASGVEVITGQKINSILNAGQKIEIKSAKGDLGSFESAILCVPPNIATGLCAKSDCLSSEWSETVPVRAACLELALSTLPVEDAVFALGMDENSYFSVHSKTAKLAPEGGALIQAALYTPAGEKAATNSRDLLEKLVSQMQPGWEDHIVHAIYRPQALVSQMLPLATKGGSSGRPKVSQPNNIYLAGDWVGDEGHLSDAAVASAKKAATLAVRQMV